MSDEGLAIFDRQTVILLCHVHHSATASAKAAIAQ
jgi:hypothetical protein